MEAPKRSSTKSNNSNPISDKSNEQQPSDIQTLVELTKKNRVKTLCNFWENVGEEPPKKSIGEYPPQLTYEEMKH